MRNPSQVPAKAMRERREMHPGPALPADSPAEAEGRRTLSTAFVRMGAGEFLTVELRDGRTIALRDVVMRRADYCGMQVGGGSSGKRYCGDYGEVAAARPARMPPPFGSQPALPEPGGAS